MSKQFADKVSIKSRYLNSDQQREIVINPLTSQIAISHSGNPHVYKQFHIDQLQHCNQEGKNLRLTFDNGRMYEIETNRPHKIDQAINHARNLQLSRRLVEQRIDKPVAINYTRFNYKNSRFQGSSRPQTQDQRGMILVQSEHALLHRAEASHYSHKDSLRNTKTSKVREKDRQKAHQGSYQQIECFQRTEDWKISKEEGSLQMVNQEWASNITKIFGFVLKKFLSTGTFMGISFPVFAMKKQTILQSYAKSIAPAPSIISTSRDTLQRFKYFSGFLWAFSVLQVAIQKPFNPVIGETFQADIRGGRYSAEQVSHHPPISAFYYQKDNYRIYGSLQLSASIGINSGDGRFVGDITIEYDDGYWVKGKLPNGKITGALIGTTLFEAYGGSYLIDSNNCVLTYKMGKNYCFEGYLGMLNYKAMKDFQDKMKSQERFMKFQPYEQQKYSRVLSKFKGLYTQWVQFDGKEYVNLNDSHNLPWNILEPFDHQLPSDSRNRKDVQLLKERKVEESQEEKEIVENVERANRKLRDNYAR